MKKLSKSEVQKKVDEFTKNIKTVNLATVDKKANPFASYSPFVEDKKGNFYVCISSLVPHSSNMYHTKKAHLLFIEDESKAANIYARQRLYFSAKVEKFEQNDKREKKIAKLFIKRFGDISKILLGMPDFRIYKLIPKEGNIVLGFGASYKLDENRKVLKQNGAKIKKAKSAHSRIHEDNM